jgi:hypothetical protein
MLDGLTNSMYLQKRDLSGDGRKMLTEEKFKHLNAIVN